MIECTNIFKTGATEEHSLIYHQNIEKGVCKAQAELGSHPGKSKEPKSMGLQYSSPFNNLIPIMS